MLEILERWQKQIESTSAQIYKFRKLLGCQECDLINSFEELQAEYTREIARQIGDAESGWLEWFWLANRMGAKGYEAGFDGKLRPINTLNDLAGLIAEEVMRRYGLAGAASLTPLQSAPQQQD